MSNDTYNETLVWCTALLVLKNMINHLLVVRCRVAFRLQGKYGNVKETPESNLNNWTLMPLAFYDILYYALLAFGPFVTDNYFERFRSMERNAVENETFFLALASVWPHAPGGLPEEWATTALLTFTYIRFVHFVLYCFIQVQPWRAIAWTVGALVVLSIAVNILFGFA